MANYYFGINRGQNEYQALFNTVSNATDVEIFVNGANVPSREETLLALKNLEQFLLRQNFPPA